ncbi:MAG: hypothetical protein KJO12_09800, partial [Ignavibacteria bacterium]|nr:hypothetical protein [Ignavibacteria bacterium]
YILIFSFLNYTGCYSSNNVSKIILYEEGQEGLPGEITIITNEAKRIELSEGSYQIVDDTLYACGFDKTNSSVFGQAIDVKIAMEDIQYAEVDEIDSFATFGCVIGVAGLVLLIIGMVSAANSANEPVKKCEMEGLKDK